MATAPIDVNPPNAYFGLSRATHKDAATRPRESPLEHQALNSQEADQYCQHQTPVFSPSSLRFGTPPSKRARTGLHTRARVGHLLAFSTAIKDQGPSSRGHSPSRRLHRAEWRQPERSGRKMTGRGTLSDTTGVQGRRRRRRRAASSMLQQRVSTDRGSASAQKRGKHHPPRARVTSAAVQPTVTCYFAAPLRLSSPNPTSAPRSSSLNGSRTEPVFARQSCV